MQELQPLSVVIGKALGQSYPVKREVCDEYIKKHSIPVAGIVPMGRGTAYLVTQETADEITVVITRENQPATTFNEEPSENEIHIGALETKCDRIELGVKRLQDEMAVLVKANNVLADKLSKVLISLGAA